MLHKKRTISENTIKVYLNGAAAARAVKLGPGVIYSFNTYAWSCAAVSGIVIHGEDTEGDMSVLLSEKTRNQRFGLWEFWSILGLLFIYLFIYVFIYLLITTFKTLLLSGSSSGRLWFWADNWTFPFAVPLTIDL